MHIFNTQNTDASSCDTHVYCHKKQKMHQRETLLKEIKTNKNVL